MVEAPVQPGSMRMGTPGARWVLFATVLGSGLAMLDATVVNVALDRIGRDLGPISGACSGRSTPTRSRSPR